MSDFPTSRSFQLSFPNTRIPKNLQKLDFAFSLLIKNEQRASGILSCGIYYDDLIQVKSLCDDQVCMILI